MAGSWNHTVERDGSGNAKSAGKLLSNLDLVSMLENGGDVYEYAEEAYGMVWWLATVLSKAVGGPMTPEVAIEEARMNYKQGLAWSPGVAPEGALEDAEAALERGDGEFVRMTPLFKEGDWVMLGAMARERLGQVQRAVANSGGTSFIVRTWLDDEGRLSKGQMTYHFSLLKIATTEQIIRHGVPASLR